MKKLLSTLLALCMAFSLLPVSVFAADGEDDDASSNAQEEDLFYEYMLQLAREQMSPSLMQTVDTAGSKLTGYAKDLYDALVPRIGVVANNGGSTEFEIPFTAFGIPEGSSWAFSVWGNKTTGQDAYDEMVSFMTAVSYALSEANDALLADMPYAMYWYDKTNGCSFSSNITGVSYDDKTISISGSPSFTVTLYVSVDYAGTFEKGGEYYYDTTAVAVGNITYYNVATAVSNAAAIVTENASMTDYEKLCAYKSAICSMVDYNQAAVDDPTTPYGNPWQLVFVFDGNVQTKVVCEGYSKAFKYLCDLSTFSGDTQCYIVNGYMAGGTGAGAHMWNIVTLDGANYSVDVTNCDDDPETDFLFLKGVTTPVTSGPKYGPQGSERYADYSLMKYQSTIYYWFDDELIWHTLKPAILTLSTEDYEPAVEAEFIISDYSMDDSRNEVYAKVERLDAGTEPFSLRIVAAAYDFDGQLLSVAVDKFTYTNDSGNDAFLTLSLNLEDFSEVCIFLLTDTFEPLCEPACMGAVVIE